jgi:hypothetical protein
MLADLFTLVGVRPYDRVAHRAREKLERTARLERLTRGEPTEARQRRAVDTAGAGNGAGNGANGASGAVTAEAAGERPGMGVAGPGGFGAAERDEAVRRAVREMDEEEERVGGWRRIFPVAEGAAYLHLFAHPRQVNAVLCRELEARRRRERASRAVAAVVAEVSAARGGEGEPMIPVAAAAAAQVVPTRGGQREALKGAVADAAAAVTAGRIRQGEPAKQTEREMLLRKAEALLAAGRSGTASARTLVSGNEYQLPTSALAVGDGLIDAAGRSDARVQACLDTASNNSFSTCSASAASVAGRELASSAGRASRVERAVRSAVLQDHALAESMRTVMRQADADTCLNAGLAQDYALQPMLYSVPLDGAHAHAGGWDCDLSAAGGSGSSGSGAASEAEYCGGGRALASVAQASHGTRAGGGHAGGRAVCSVAQVSTDTHGGGGRMGGASVIAGEHGGWSRDALLHVPSNAPMDVSTSMDASKDASQVTRTANMDVSRDAFRDASKDASMVMYGDASAGASTDASRDVSRDASCGCGDAPMNASIVASRDASHGYGSASGNAASADECDASGAIYSKGDSTFGMPIVLAQHLLGPANVLARTKVNPSAHASCLYKRCIGAGDAVSAAGLGRDGAAPVRGFHAGVSYQPAPGRQAAATYDVLDHTGLRGAGMAILSNALSTSAISVPTLHSTPRDATAAPARERTTSRRPSSASHLSSSAVFPSRRPTEPSPAGWASAKDACMPPQGISLIGSCVGGGSRPGSRPASAAISTYGSTARPGSAAPRPGTEVAARSPPDRLAPYVASAYGVPLRTGSRASARGGSPAWA